MSLSSDELRAIQHFIRKRGDTETSPEFKGLSQAVQSIQNLTEENLFALLLISVKHQKTLVSSPQKTHCPNLNLLYRGLSRIYLDDPEKITSSQKEVLPLFLKLQALIFKKVLEQCDPSKKSDVPGLLETLLFAKYVFTYIGAFFSLGDLPEGFELSQYIGTHEEQIQMNCYFFGAPLPDMTKKDRLHPLDTMSPSKKRDYPQASVLLPSLSTAQQDCLFSGDYLKACVYSFMYLYLSITTHEQPSQEGMNEKIQEFFEDWHTQQRFLQATLSAPLSMPKTLGETEGRQEGRHLKSLFSLLYYHMFLWDTVCCLNIFDESVRHLFIIPPQKRSLRSSTGRQPLGRGLKRNGSDKGGARKRVRFNLPPADGRRDDSVRQPERSTAEGPAYSLRSGKKR